MKKRSLLILMALAIAIGAMGSAVAVYSIQANADPGISVNVGGKNIELENVNGANVDPIYIDGSVYLPVRAISEAMGYDVSWDGDTKTVMIGQPVVVKSVVANCTSEP